MLACKYAQLNAAELLLEQGADMNIINKVSWCVMFTLIKYISNLIMSYPMTTYSNNHKLSTFLREYIFLF